MTSVNYRAVVVKATDAKEVSMGELRERMQQALILHGMAPRTQEAYLTAVQDIAKYYHQRPDTLSEAQLQAYIRFLLDERHLSASSVRVAIMGIRFFYTQTLRRPWPHLPLPKRTKTLPEVLSREEGARLLASTTNVRQHALLMTTYGGGLRVSEVVRLQVSDIDAGRGMLRVEQGKGRKDRYTLLGPRLLAELRRYWQLYRPVAPWLFPKQTKPEPMPIVTAQRMYYEAKERAGITKAGGIHALRHAFTTHLLEGGADLATLQRLLGPESVTTTMHYVHLAQHQLTAHGSPLESLPDVAVAG
jgi:site-specific recombinase XerD